MARRARPASEINKAVQTSTSLENGGKKQPAAIPARKFPGERAKVPPIEEAKTEELEKHCGCGEPVQKPLATPTGESKDAFIERCMGDSSMGKEFPDAKQRYAVCNSQWRAASKSAPALGDIDPSMFHVIGPGCISKEDLSKEDMETLIKTVDWDKAAEQIKKWLNDHDNGSGNPGVPVPVSVETEKAHERSVMLALPVPGHIAKTLKVDGGEPEEEMHLTLCFCGKLNKDVAGGPTEDQIEALKEEMKAYSRKAQPLVGKIGGIGRFAASDTSDGMDVLYASADVPDLPDFRHEMKALVEKCGMNVSKSHGFTPHITMAYIKPGDKLPVETVERSDVEFKTVALYVGKERFDYGLGTSEVSKALEFPILKAERRLVTGVVLQPEVVDAQGDIISAEVIEQAAHKFLADYNRGNQLGEQHRYFPPGLQLVESWVAPVDLELAGKRISKGTWLMTVHVENDEIWNKVKSGLIRGFSIGGVAKIQRLAA